MLKLALEAQAQGNLLVTCTDAMQAQILDMTHANDVIRECGDTCPTLQARMGTDGNQIPLVIKPECLTLWDYQSKRIYAETGSYPCLQARENSGTDQTAVLTVKPTYCIQGNNIERSDTAKANSGQSFTLHEAHSHGVIYAIDRAAFNQGKNAKYDFQIDDSISGNGIAGTLDASYYKGVGARSGIEREVVAIPHQVQQIYVWIVRRLMPVECERLQGYEDNWTKYDTKSGELKDTPRYKALGNSIAIPCAERVFQGIIEVEEK